MGLHVVREVRVIQGLHPHRIEPLAGSPRPDPEDTRIRCRALKDRKIAEVHDLLDPPLLQPRPQGLPVVCPHPLVRQDVGEHPACRKQVHPPLDKIHVEIGGALVHAVMLLEIGLLILDALLPHIRRVRDHHIEPRILAQEDLREVEFPEEERLCPVLPVRGKFPAGISIARLLQGLLDEIPLQLLNGGPVLVLPRTVLLVEEESLVFLQFPEFAPRLLDAKGFCLVKRHLSCSGSRACKGLFLLLLQPRDLAPYPA